MSNSKILRAPAPAVQPITLEYSVPTDKDAKSESKNYWVYQRESDDKKEPVLLGSNGKLYIDKKAFADPAKVKRIVVTVTPIFD